MAVDQVRAFGFKFTDQRDAKTDRSVGGNGVSCLKLAHGHFAMVACFVHVTKLKPHKVASIEPQTASLNGSAFQLDQPFRKSVDVNL